MLGFASHQADLFAPLWLAWILAFVVIELAAIWYYRKHPTEPRKGGTLSELVWRLKRYKLPVIVLAVFAVVLLVHFIWEV